MSDCIASGAGLAWPAGKSPKDPAMTKRNPARHTAAGLHATSSTAVSPLVLCDHLIQVAQEADRAGYAETAAQLVAALERLFDTPPQRH